MAGNGFLVASILLFCLVGISHGVLLSTLPRTLLLTASPKEGEVVKAGEHNITVTWGLNQSFPAGTDSSYKTIKVKLCYAPISQKDRAWRKTVDDLKKDKTCQFFIVKSMPYTKTNTTVDWVTERDIPQGTYFVRAYAFNSEGVQVGYGQTTNGEKTSNLFVIQAITGRHLSLDIASVCFSVFAILALLGFFYMEKRNAKTK